MSKSIVMFCCLSAPVFGQVHGAFVGTVCDDIRCEGENLNCVTVIGNADSFGDTLKVNEAFHLIQNQRIPAAGNLRISEVNGNALCTDVGGVCDVLTGKNCILPCYIGHPSSTLNGLPGEPFAGEVRFEQREYIVPQVEATHSAVPDVVIIANVVVGDQCDSQHTQGCSDLPNTLQYLWATRVTTCPAELCFRESCADGICTYTPECDADEDCDNGDQCLDVCEDGCCVICVPPFFSDCMTGPTASGDVDLNCQTFDLDNNGQIDLRDFQLVQNNTIKGNEIANSSHRE